MEMRVLNGSQRQQPPVKLPCDTDSSVKATTHWSFLCFPAGIFKPFFFFFILYLICGHVLVLAGAELIFLSVAAVFWI